jgi:hypothetical protein
MKPRIMTFSKMHYSLLFPKDRHAYSNTGVGISKWMDEYEKFETMGRTKMAAPKLKI